MTLQARACITHTHRHEPGGCAQHAGTKTHRAGAQGSGCTRHTLSHTHLQAAPAGSNPLVSQSCFLGPKVTGPAHVAGGYGGFEGQETEQRPPSPVRLGSKLQESKKLGLVPCREAGLHLHGDRAHSGLLLYWAGGGEGGHRWAREPWTALAVIPSPNPSGTTGPGCPARPPLPGFCPLSAISLTRKVRACPSPPPTCPGAATH